ncbi:PucR family transcriptional regulator [Corynebacterium stationis]|uniref:PucR family transcriptional regulator n=2 Tax=Corynebacterium stationis TaxID=1705 RepID=UPI00076F738C|nr:PucR family transcriptional regulator [Corynebacterium stationis]AMJ45109.1 hypothetical protein AW169_09695 [Corynebacterium stationis]AQX71564.1 PucR family transcriptional regulator [Corynebacterium stationis]ASJ19247.1 hypothetical protein BA700_09695 [Corynebacterium stationis]
MKPLGVRAERGVEPQRTLELSHMLKLPELAEAQTELVVGHEWLNRPIRWVHVADSRRAGQLLRGGELLLSTGSGWGSAPEQIREHVQSFAEAGAAALLVELGTTWQEVPPEIVEECQKLQLPLLVSRKELRFVSVTESVHQAILDQRIEEITMMNAVVETMSALLYNGAPTEQIVVQCGRLLQAPVVLEDPSHAVVCYAEGHHLPSKLLAGWRQKSRGWKTNLESSSMPTVVEDPEMPGVQWTFVEIRGQGTVLGRLFYRMEKECSPVAHHILRHTAMTLAVYRLGSSNPHVWTELIEHKTLERLVGSRFNSVEGAEEVLEVSGFPVRGRALFCCEVFHETAALSPSIVRENIHRRLKDTRALISMSSGNPRRLTCALSLPLGADESLVFTLIADIVKKNFSSRSAVVTSKRCEGALELAMTMRELRRLTDVRYAKNQVRVVALAETPLDGLVNQLRDDVRVQGFSAQLLGPVLRYDKEHGTELMVTLQAVLEHPASRSAAAQALHLSRTALYSRIERIEELVNLDLSEGSAQFALGLAIRAHSTVN